jgi:two-component sensor histidine kinase
LRSLLSDTIAPHGAGPERVVLRGEDVRLRPRAALMLAMAVHELVTNAAKYGALSAPAGRVEIRWRATRDETGRPLLGIDWREVGDLRGWRRSWPVFALLGYAGQPSLR